MATVPEPWSQNNEEGTRCARRKRCGKCQRCAQWMLETTAREHTVAYEHSFGKTNPVLITLGYQARDGLAPSDWLDIDRKAWPELKRRWKKRWDAMPPHLWSLQWTQLHVVHRHIVMPSSGIRLLELREWLLQTWASIIGVSLSPEAGHEHLVDIRWKRHVLNLMEYVLSDIGQLFEVVAPPGATYRRWDASDDWPECRSGRWREFIGTDGAVYDWHEYRRAKGRYQHWRRRLSEAEKKGVDRDELEVIRHNCVEAAETIERWRERQPDPNSWQRRGDKFDEWVALINGEIVWLQDGDRDDSFYPASVSYSQVMSQTNRAWERLQQCETIQNPFGAQLRFETAKCVIEIALLQVPHLHEPDERFLCLDQIGVVIGEGQRIAAQLPYRCPGCEQEWNIEGPLLSERCLSCERVLWRPGAGSE